MVRCENCGEIISIHNDVCPYCGALQRRGKKIGEKTSGIAIFKALIVGLSLMFLGMVLGLFTFGLLGMGIGTLSGLSLGLCLGTKMYLPNQSKTPTKTPITSVLILLIVFFVTFILIFLVFSMTPYQPPKKRNIL